MKLKRYWFKFKLSKPHPIGTLLGCGVTASSRDEALEVLQQKVFRNQSLPSIEECIENVELGQLDARHVLPNSGDSSKQGIWFPLGYE